MPDRITSRPYSISTHPCENRLGFLISALPSGTVSTFLANCPIGTEIGTSPPFGQLNLIPATGMIWVATGTGISPFLSHLRGQNTEPPERLLYGVRYSEEVLALKLLRARSPLELFISGEEAAGAHYGRILADHSFIPADTKKRYAVCGHGALAQALTARLVAEGVPKRSIQKEIFFPV